jgi:hypothetical protein
VATADLGHNGAGGPLTDTDTLALVVQPPNAAPVAAAQSVSTGEDTPLTITLSASDADGDALTLATATGPANGSLGALGAVTCSGATPNVCTADVTYTPAADSFGPDSFTFTASDGIATSAAATITITVNAVNDAPRLESIEAGALAYTENEPATPITAATTVADVDSANFDTGTLTVDYQAGGTADDRLELANQGTGPGQVGVSGANVSYEGTQIGTFSGGSGTTPLVVTLDADATAAATQALARAVTYRNVSDAPSTAARAARFVLTDGDGGTSAAATRAIAMTAVNDLPVVDLDAAGTLAYTENAGFQNLFGPSATVVDIDSPALDSLTVTITGGFDAAFDTLELNTAGFTTNFAGGALTITRAGGTPADFTTALRNVRFRNTDDDPDDRNDGTPNPAAADRTVSVVADDGPATSAPVTRDVTITPVNDAPGAPSPLVSTNGVRNTTLVSGVTATEPHVVRSVDPIGNATDPDGLESAITVVPASAVATTQGGRITLAADGDVRYEPPASVTLPSDTYGYQLTDGTTASPAITFTVNLAGEVWYVADGAPLPRDGTAARPFDTLAAALAVATTNDAIHLRRAPGDGTLAGGVTLQSGQKLIGEGVALTNTDVGTGTAETLFAAGTKPVLTAAGVDVVTLASSTEIAGLSINPDGAGGGLAGANPTGVIVRSTDITDGGTQATQAGIELTTGGGLTFAGTVSVSTTVARALDLTGTALSGTLASTSVSSGANGGVALTNTTGNLTFQTLSLTTSAGTGFLLANAAGIDVNGAGFATAVSSTGGPAVDATALANGSDLVFDTVSSSGGSKGVNLDGTGGWTFSAGAGSAITGATTVAFDVNGGSGDITYAGTINNGPGLSLDMTNRTGGTVLVSGTITDSNDAGGGITATSNTGAALRITGSGNVIDSGSQTAVNVQNTTIGTGGLNFQALSSSGASNGIVLNSTGSTAGLTVSGSGGTCSSVATCTGGAIQNASGTANVALSNVGGAVSLTRMYIGGSGNDGILGTTVGGLTLAAGIVTGNGNAVGDDGLDFTGLTGTVNLTSQTVTGSGDRNVDISNDSGTLTMTVTGSTFSNTSAATGDDGLVVLGTGSGSITLNIQSSTFIDNKGDHVNMATDGDATVSENLTINGSSFSTTAANQGPGGYVVGGGITVNPGGSSDVVTSITSNNIQRATDEAIIIDTPGSNVSAQPVNFDVTVTGNTIGTSGTTGSGSSTGTGIFVSSNGLADVDARVSNNVVREYENGHGIHLVQNDGNGLLDATVQGNTITDPGTFAQNGIQGAAGAASGDAGTLCLDIGHASSAGFENDVDAGGLDVNVGEEDMRVRHRFNTTVRLVGYAGGQFSTTDVVNYLIPRNDAGGVPTASAAVNTGFGGGFANTAACEQPDGVP